MEDDQILQVGGRAGALLQSEVPPPRRILVVEDHADIRHLNAEMLVQSGYHVDAVEDGAAAWDSLQRGRYDLVVTDNDMPKVSGVELIERMHVAGMALPVIMATGSLPSAFTRCPWLQPAAILLKPYSCQQLLATVNKVLCSASP